MKSSLILGLVASVLVVSACGTGPSIETREALAQCVTDAGWTMYGAERCSHCKAQKQLFGTAFEQINYVECTEQEEVCSLAGVTGYPTWISQDGSRLSGQQSLESLANAAGCAVDTATQTK